MLFQRVGVSRQSTACIVISAFDDDEQKNSVLRGNGLKVEQLKGELEMALHGGHDH